MKVDEILKDFRERERFGRVIAVISVIEFQKRGLPHAHTLLFLHPDDKPNTTFDIDNIISAEIPNKDEDPQLFDIVVQSMIHGPCGSLDNRAPCMMGKKCSKHFPKNFTNETSFDEDGFTRYRRRDNLIKAIKNGVEVDNRWVVPYNPGLLKDYNAHINVGFCNRARMIKYLFKYINKGKDRGVAVIEENITASNSQGEHVTREVDEIKTFLDCRYISAPESCWRIFGFDIQCRYPPVERLQFHLDKEQTVIFHDNDDLVDVMNRPNAQRTMFTEWMRTNAMFEDARHLTYVDFPTKWVWKSDTKEWTRKKKGFKIGRLYYAHPTSGERFYLRMLLNIQKGPRSYEEIKTVNNVHHVDFKSACLALGLLENDNEWDDAITDASRWAGSYSLRQLFVTILLFCEVNDPLQLWNKHWELFADDILRNERQLLDNNELVLPAEELKDRALYEVENIMNQSNRSLKDFPMMPFPDMTSRRHSRNRLIREELMYECNELRDEFERLHRGLNVEQKTIFDIVINAVESRSGGFILSMVAVGQEKHISGIPYYLSCVQKVK